MYVFKIEKKNLPRPGFEPTTTYLRLSGTFLTSRQVLASGTRSLPPVAGLLFHLSRWSLVSMLLKGTCTGGRCAGDSVGILRFKLGVRTVNDLLKFGPEDLGLLSFGLCCGCCGAAALSGLASDWLLLELPVKNKYEFSFLQPWLRLLKTYYVRDN